jgi:hypothetical protein
LTGIFPVNATPMDLKRAREEVLGYRRDSRVRLADEVQPHAFGTAMLMPSLPRALAAGRLVVAKRPANRDAAELSREALCLLGAPGSRARISVDDPVLAERLEPGLRELGWQVAHNVVMVDAGIWPADFDDGAIEEPPAPALDSLLSRIYSAYWDAITNEQMRALDRRAMDRLEARIFTAPRDEPVAAAQLRSLGGVGEVIAVNTIESGRRAGHGGTALAAAVATSRQRNRLTMLAADATDWPREWYRRLGFVEVGDVWEFDNVSV